MYVFVTVPRTWRLNQGNEVQRRVRFATGTSLAGPAVPGEASCRSTLCPLACEWLSGWRRFASSADQKPGPVPSLKHSRRSLLFHQAQQWGLPGSCLLTFSGKASDLGPLSYPTSSCTQSLKMHPGPCVFVPLNAHFPLLWTLVPFCFICPPPGTPNTNF